MSEVRRLSDSRGSMTESFRWSQSSTAHLELRCREMGGSGRGGGVQRGFGLMHSDSLVCQMQFWVK